MTPAVKLLLIINGAVFLLNFLAVGRLSNLLQISWQGLGEGYGLGVVRLVSYQFVHDYRDLMHILMNMLVLFFFGTMVESDVGKRGLLRLYLVSGVVGGMLELLFGLSMGFDPKVIGASGACYGIMVYAACMAPRMRVIFFIFPIEMRWLVGFLVFMGVYSTLVSLTGGPSGGVAHRAHLGGALWGFLAFRYFRSFYMTLDFRPSPLLGKLGKLGKLGRWRRGRLERGRARRRAVMDGLLDKVHSQGVNSLSAAERRFLESESRRKR